MAHWFLGLSQCFSSESRLAAAVVAPALKAAPDSVYAAIENPVEGTIVSVMRCVGDAAVEKAAADRVHLGELTDGRHGCASRYGRRAV